MTARVYVPADSTARSLGADGLADAIAERVPEEALVYLPYDDCGRYGGMLRGLVEMRGV